MGVPVDTHGSPPYDRLHIPVIDQTKHTGSFPRIFLSFGVEGDGSFDVSVGASSQSTFFV